MKEPTGVVLAKGRVEWPEQLLLLGIKASESYSYPPGSKKPVNLFEACKAAYRSGVHIERIEYRENGSCEDGLIKNE